MTRALLKTASPDGLPERRLVNQGAQVVLIRQAQPAVVLVEPRHGEFQRAAGVEAGCPWVGVDQPFRLPRRLVQCRPLRLQEGEVAHRQSAPLKAWC